MTLLLEPDLTPDQFMESIAARRVGGNTPFAAMYAEQIREAIIRQASRDPRSVQRALGPSELGHVCHRHVVGKMAGKPRTNNVDDPWPSVVGRAVHAWLAEKFLLENTTYGTPRWVTEQRVTAPEFPGNPGTADLYDGHYQVLGDWKVLGETTLNKVKSKQGPPWHYRVQMKIYAAGYRALALPVWRNVLIALPRTKSSLHEMYCWEEEYVPARDDAILTRVAAITEQRRKVAQMVMQGRIRIEDVPVTPGEECFHCLRGDTEVVTRDGIKLIRELAGTTPELLVPDTQPDGHLSVRGTFRKAEVRAFGQQRLWRIRLRNHGAAKDVFATAEHRWQLTQRPSRANPDNKHGHMIQGRQRPPEYFMRTTATLRPGDRLRPLRAHSARDQNLVLVPDAVARGFVYGDGCLPAGRSKSEVSFFDRSNGKYEALMPFFPDHRDRVRTYTTVGGDTTRRIRNLPASGKQQPDLGESPDYLLSWLAGYFAADGNVSPDGQATLSSARAGNIMLAQDIAATCGVGHGTARSRSRLGYGSEPTLLWDLTLRRRDLPDWFFIRPQHQANAARANEDPSRETYWSVESVTETDQVEEVYCAVVPGEEAFGLAGGIMTSNCPFYRPQSALDGRPGCPGHSPAPGIEPARLT